MDPFITGDYHLRNTHCSPVSETGYNDLFCTMLELPAIDHNLTSENTDSFDLFFEHRPNQKLSIRKVSEEIQPENDDRYYLVPIVPKSKKIKRIDSACTTDCEPVKRLKNSQIMSKLNRIQSLKSQISQMEQILTTTKQQLVQALKNRHM